MMIAKTELLGIVGVTSATISLGATLMNKKKASMAALSLSNLALIGLTLADYRRSKSRAVQTQRAWREDLRDQKLLIKEVRNSEILKHRRLEKYVSDLSEAVNKFAGSVGGNVSSAPSLESLTAVKESFGGDIQSSFEKLTRRVSKAHPVTAITEGGERRQRVLFVSSNGAGLGHLTRISAVDRQLSADTLIYTMSSAYHRLGKPSKDIIYFPSHGDLGMDGKDWNEYQEAHFGAVVRGFKPDAIVFDGTYVYRGVIRVARKQKIKLIWMQRGCWRPEIDQRSKQRHAASKVCDAVIVPGDYGCEEIVDLGGKLEPNYVQPITLTTVGDLFSREEARAKLDLPQDKKLFLVQLGAGVINDIADLRTTVVRAIQALGDDWQPVLVRNPLSAHSELSEVPSIQAYPLGLYYNAFDAGAFAAGYNTVQESIELGLPGIFIPNLETKTDDQLRRADSVAEAGVALTATELVDVTDAVERIARDEIRYEMRAKMERIRQSGGAHKAAEVIHDLITKWKK